VHSFSDTGEILSIQTTDGLMESLGKFSGDNELCRCLGFTGRNGGFLGDDASSECAEKSKEQVGEGLKVSDWVSMGVNDANPAV
jgi:hypothetical protein